MSTLVDHDANSSEESASNEKEKQAETLEASPAKQASKRPTHPAAKKAPAKKTKKAPGRHSAARSRARKQQTAARTSGTKPGKASTAKSRHRGKAPSERQLVERALRQVKKQLDTEDDLQPSTIGVLEKLLKMHRDLVEEEEMPQEIRVLWQEINGESSSEE